MIFALIFIYIANPEYEECPRSQLVSDAFSRPIEEYEEILGDSSVAKNHIRDLKASRADVDEIGLSILTRDAAGLDSTVELPAWGLTAHDLTPFVRDNGPSAQMLLEDPVTIVRHVRYLHNLNALVRDSPREVHLADLTFEAFVHSRTIRNREERWYEDRFKLPLAPWPRPIDLILKSRRLEIVRIPLEDQLIVRETNKHIFAGADTASLMRMLDMGTGILNLEEE